MRIGKRSAGTIFGHGRRRRARLGNGPVTQEFGQARQRLGDVGAYRADVVGGWTLMQLEWHLRSRG